MSKRGPTRVELVSHHPRLSQLQKNANQLVAMVASLTPTRSE